MAKELTTSTQHSGAIEVFYSYCSDSQDDEKLREQLEKHLSSLKRAGVITGWHSRKIGAGQEWRGEVDRHLATARIILLLVSADFIASDYCSDVEVKQAMVRHEAGEARVIPIILRPVTWGNTPFGNLSPLPQGGKPITIWKNWDEAIVSVVEGIEAVIEEITVRRPGRSKSQGQSKHFPIRCSPWRIICISLGTALTVLLVRFMGGLQPLEMLMFDHLMQGQSDILTDPRLLVIQADNSDRTFQLKDSKDKKEAKDEIEGKEITVTDETLEKLLDKLNKSSAIAIGLDLRRPEKAKTRKLKDLLISMSQTHKLFTICAAPEADNEGKKISDAVEVAHPPEVNTNSVGFAELVPDKDGIIRRHLLAQSPPKGTERCNVEGSFSLSLAGRYLEKKEIQYRIDFPGNSFYPLEKECRIEFKKNGKLLIAFGRFNPYFGGYQGNENNTGGCQTILNYRAKLVSTITVKKFLEETDSGDVENRIVLIGTAAGRAPYTDVHNTPYGKSIPGVNIQAQMVSQILDAVLMKIDTVQQGRPLIWVIPIWAESLWILFWSLLGGVIAWLFRTLKFLAIAFVIAFVSLYVICSLIFGLSGGWLPFVPAVLTLFISGGGMAYSSFSLIVGSNKNISNLHHDSA